MNYREAISWLSSIESLGIKLALKNVTAVLGALGDPQRRFDSVLVAGTNGKGSVAAMLESILGRSGRRTGLYTSPHLVRHEERIQIAGRPVGEDDFARGISRVKEAAESLTREGRLEAHPTHFETVTAAAFQLFAEAGVEIAVLEVGMGGRLDATVLSEPKLAVLTNVALEHTQWLGDTIQAIAREKAGVLLAGGTLLAGEAAPEAVEVFRARAAEVGGRYVPLDEYAEIVPSKPDSLAGTMGSATGAEALPAKGFGTPGVSTLSSGELGAGEEGVATTRLAQALAALTIRTRQRLHRDLRVGLAGAFQRRNAVLAVAAADLLDEMGIAVPAQAVAEGLATSRWPGRMHLLEGEPRVLLDGAHNPAACRALRETLLERMLGGGGDPGHLRRRGHPLQGPHGGRAGGDARGGDDPGNRALPARGLAPSALDDMTLLLGVLRDKDARAMARELGPLARRVVATRGVSSRFRDPFTLVADLKAEGIDARASGDLEEGLRLAREMTPPDGIVLVTGSLYLVGDLMRLLGVEPWPAPPTRSGRPRRFAPQAL